jgi:sugar phosphate permease
MDVEKKSYFPWLIWACASLFYGYQFCLRVSPSVMTNELMASLGVEFCALGSLSAFYYYAYSFFQIPAGALLDHYGPRRVLLTAMLICGLGGILFALSNSVVLGSLGRFLIGTGSAFAFLGCVKVGTMWFRPEKLSFVIGCSILIGTSGAIGGGMPLAWAVHQMGWRPTMIALSLLAPLLFILAFFFLKDKKVKITPSQNTSLFEGLRIVCANPQSWILGLYGILMYAPLSVFGDLWGVPFLTDVYHMDHMQASGLVSLVYVGMGICAPLAYLALKGFKSYRRCLFWASLATTLILGVICCYTVPSGVLAVLIFALGCTLAGQFLAFPVVCEVNPSHLSATASGIQNMICMCSGVILQPMVGWVLDLTASDGGRNYPLALSIMPICTLVSCVLVYFIKETYAKEQEEAPAS